VLLAAMAGRMTLSLALSMLLGRYLSAAEFGFFVLVSAVFTIARDFTDMGSGNVAIRDTVRAPLTERHMLETLLGFRWGLGAVAALACIALALFEPSRWHRIVLLTAAPVLMVSYLSAFYTVFQIRQAQLAPALVSVLAQLAMLVGSGLLLGVKAAGVLVSVLVPLRELGILIVIRIFAVRLLGYRPLPRLKNRTMHPFFGKATVVAISTLFYHLQFQGGIFFVHLMRPEDELGAFGAAFRPFQPLLTVPWVLMLPLVPLLSWLAATRREEFQRQVQGALHLCTGIGAVVAVGSEQLAPVVLELLYGAKFIEGPLAAVDVFRWMSLPLGCSFATAATATALLADNREKRLLQLSLFSLVFYVGANLVLVPRYRFTGGAIATALAVIVMTLAGLLLLREGVGGFAPGMRLAIFLLPATGLFAVFRLLPAATLLQLALGGLLTGVAVIAVWHLPGVSRYRAEQARLSDLALPRSPRQERAAADE
jgi:O-antigen/teichoic acid export membrane protein